MAADVQTPPPAVDAQDPLPESKWFWRRLYIFIITTVIIIGVFIMVQTMVNLASDQPILIVGAFVKIISWVLLFAWFVMTYYVIAPSGEQIVKMWQAATMFKSGVFSSTTQTATGVDGSVASATTTTGPVVQPTPTLPGAGAAPSANRLPVMDAGYTGPPDEDVPPPPPGTPDKTPW